MGLRDSAVRSERLSPKAVYEESMPIICSIYGLGLQVNVPLGGLAGLPRPVQIDVRMTLGAMPTDVIRSPNESALEYYASPEVDAHGRPAVRVASLLGGKYHRIVYSDGTVVVVDSIGSCVWATAPESATVEDTATYLLGPVLGFVLRLRGVTCLHASAVVVDGQAIALVGVSGAGKSTTAAAFARMGYSVLADDVVALVDHGGRFDIQPAYPRLRLWPESVSSMFGSVEALPLITPNWHKRFLDLNSPGCQFERAPAPLTAVYFLGERSSAAEVPVVEAVSARTGLMALVSDTYVSYLLDSTRRAKEFQVLGRLVANVPLRQATASTDFERIPHFCQAIVDDFRQITELP